MKSFLLDHLRHAFATLAWQAARAAAVWLIAAALFGTWWVIARALGF